MTDLLRAAAEAALASDHSRGATEMIDDRLRIERLVRANARRAMVIDIIERLVEDPEREDFGPSDMEYWSPLHDALREKLRAALAEPDAEPYKRSERASPVLVESEALRLCTHKNDSPQSFILGWRAAEAYHEVGGVA